MKPLPRFASVSHKFLQRQNTRESMQSAHSLDIQEAKSSFRKTRAVSDLNNPKALFADAQTAKTAALQRICHVDPLKSLYRSEDWVGKIVNSPFFTHASTILVLANTLWIAVETDNKEADGYVGHWLISIDSAFCFLFLVELTFRCMALKRVHFFMLDGWLMTDTALCLMNIIEAWLVPFFSSDHSTDGASGPLRVLRVLRLSRIARTLTLFRLVPELTLLIRSITQALRAVFAVICLLMLYVYVNALYFTGLARGTELEHKYFKDVPTSMKSLVVHGTLLDEVAMMMDLLADESWVLTSLFVVFIFITACLLLNMLVGVLVEVVTVTASVEQEEHLGQFVIEAFKIALQNIGHDGRAKITKKQFERVVRQGVMNEVLRVLNINVDRRTLLEYVFEPEGDSVDTVPISAVVLTLLQLRATSPATVRDVLDARRIVLLRVSQLDKAIKDSKTETVSKGGARRKAKPRREPKGPAAPPSPRLSMGSVASQDALQDSEELQGLRESLGKDFLQEFQQATRTLCDLQVQLQKELTRSMAATRSKAYCVYDDEDTPDWVQGSADAILQDRFDTSKLHSDHAGLREIAGKVHHEPSDDSPSKPSVGGTDDLLETTVPKAAPTRAFSPKAARSPAVPSPAGVAATAAGGFSSMHQVKMRQPSQDSADPYDYGKERCCSTVSTAANSSTHVEVGSEQVHASRQRMGDDKKGGQPWMIECVI